MAVTTVTSTETFDTGFRAWVSVTHAAAAVGGDVLVDVQLRWNSTQAAYVAPDGSSPAPTLLSPALGVASWAGVVFASGENKEFGVLLQCIQGFTDITTITGIAAEQGSGTRHSSADDWDCDTPAESGLPH